MLSVFDGLRSVTTLSVFVRLACAFICGGIIGIERSYKRRPAGFRTHILICIGAAITTLTSQYHHYQAAECEGIDNGGRTVDLGHHRSGVRRRLL